VQKISPPPRRVKLILAFVGPVARRRGNGGVKVNVILFYEYTDRNVILVERKIMKWTGIVGDSFMKRISLVTTVKVRCRIHANKE
jgi:hypothetical protein